MNDLLTLNFPSDEMKEARLPDLLLDSLNIIPIESFKGKTDYMVVIRIPG